MDTKVINQISGEAWHIYNGDCVDVSEGIPDQSVGLSIFSPPFASLYTYSASDRDMGNCKSHDEFAKHFRFLIRQLYRVTMDGRLCCVHCMNLPMMKQHHGYIGIQDFRGGIIRAFESEGWIYHSEVCIWKDPVTAMQRTKALGLLHKQVVKDSCMSRQGVPDYVCTFRKPGTNTEPVEGELDRFVGDKTTFSNNGRLSIDIWQKYASPVWMDINPSNTLQFRSARDNDDERHISPLQLEVIGRCLQLWSNPGDVVLDPFSGIGSTGWCAVQEERKYIGIELKESYYNASVKNMVQAENKYKEGRLF